MVLPAAAIDNLERYVTGDYPPDLFALPRLLADGATQGKVHIMSRVKKTASGLSEPCVAGIKLGHLSFQRSGAEHFLAQFAPPRLNALHGRRSSEPPTHNA